MAGAALVARVVGAARRRRPARGRVVHRRGAHVRRVERLRRDRGRGRRSDFAARRHLGAHLQRLRAGRGVPAAVRRDSRRLRRSPERRAEAGAAAADAGVLADRREGRRADGRLADRDVARRRGGAPVARLRRIDLSARARRRGHRPFPQCGADGRARVGGRGAHRSSVHRRHRHARGDGRDVDRQLHRRRAGRPLGAGGRIHADRDGGRIPARADPSRRAARRDRARARGSRRRGNLDAARHAGAAPRPGIGRRRGARGGGGVRGGLPDGELGLFREPHELVPEGRRGSARADPRAAADRGAPRRRGSAPRGPRAQGALEAAPRPAEDAGAVRRRHVDGPLRADEPALRRDLVRARRPPRDEPHDDGRGRARDDLLAGGNRRHRRRERECVSRSSARGPPAPRGRGVLRRVAGARRRGRRVPLEEAGMKGFTRRAVALGVAIAVIAPLAAAEIKVDLSKEKTGSVPKAFEPMVGTWVVAEDAGQKVIMVDGRPWVASKDNPTKLLIESARKLYGTNNEELMDNAKQFAYYPVAVMKDSPEFSNGTISVKFKTIAGEADRASGILFNVKPNGDWLAIRYNDTENNVALWEFHNGIRRNMRFSDRNNKFMLDRSAWHELKMTVDGADFKAWLDGQLALEYTLGAQPGPGRSGAAPNPDLFPENNAVLRPPVKGKIGLWAKTDTTSYFKDYVVSPK